MNTNTYRPDIDGLRSLAVLSVLIFHAFPHLIPGGFVGVDVFFVISGFLISSLIKNDLIGDSFSLKTFYRRRIKRIFPALCLVLSLSLLLGWVIMTPQEYEQLGTHIAASAGFIPNFIFWKEAGYFDKEAILKPLLHLWSLGVEEQFYVIWPAVLFLGWRILKSNLHSLWWFCVLLLLLSLGFSLFQLGKNPVADFYSPLTRFWELALGGTLALRPNLSHIGDRKLTLIAGWLGLCCIFIAIFTFNENTPFPGHYALLPCLGAFGIIYSGTTTLGRQPYSVSQLLSFKFFVWIGLISYPLYLWHWPLLSFARILEGQTISVGLRITLLILSGVLAYLTYILIEKPLRLSKKSIVVWGLIAAMLALLTCGIVLRKKDGFKGRHPNMMSADPLSMVLGKDKDSLLKKCSISEQIPSHLDCFEDIRGNVQYAMLGDSKAEALFYGLTQVSSEKGRWLLVDGVHPPPINAALDNPSYIDSKKVFNIIGKIPSIHVVAITMAMRGIYPIDKSTGLIIPGGDPDTQFVVYDEAITTLESAGKRIIFVIDNPTFPDPTSCISGGLTPSDFLNQFFLRKANPYCQVSYQEHISGTKAYRDWVDRLKTKHPQLEVIDTAPLLCDVTANLCSISEGRNFLYSYSDHISDYAAKKIGRILTPIADKINASKSSQ